MNNTKIGIGSGDKVLDWGVIITACILFTKTADVLSLFAPLNLNEIFGFDTSLLYGIVCALLVEGLALSLHFNHRAALSSTAQAVKWVLIGISAMCQVFDGFVTTNTVYQMSDTMKAAFSYGVPLIPLSILVMVFGIGQLPELETHQMRPNKPFIGLRPTWNRFINGEVAAPQHPQLPVSMGLDLPSQELENANHKQSDVLNPTIRGEK